MPIEIEQTQTLEPLKELKQVKELSEPPTVDHQATSTKLDTNPDTSVNNFNPELEHDLQVKLQPILLDSAINALGHTLAKVTSLEDMDFTEDEHKALVDAWTPLLPSVSPMTNAVLVTVIILSGKALLYYSVKKKSKPGEAKSLPVESKEIKEAVN